MNNQEFDSLLNSIRDDVPVNGRGPGGGAARVRARLESDASVGQSDMVDAAGILRGFSRAAAGVIANGR